MESDLSEIATNISVYATANYLSLSAEKTQVLWSGLPQGTIGPAVNIDGVLVDPSPSIEILGVKFDKNLSPAHFLASQYKAAAPILATVRRLSRYLPRAQLAEVSSSFLVGKLAYAAPATIVPRLSPDEPARCATQKLQVCINDAARTIMGVSIQDKTPIETLLVKTGLPSLNRLAVKGIALECWRAINMATPLGSVICGGFKATRPTRLNLSNKLAPPFKFPKDSMAWHAMRIWNKYDELRSASTLHGAKRVAARIASTCPL